MLTVKEISVSGQQIAEVLNTTTLKILKAVRNEPLDVSTISKRLGLSESHVSHEVRALEELNLINVTYERGKRGIRKISSSTIEKITINIGDEDHSFF